MISNISYTLQLKNSASIAVTGKIGENPFIQNISCSDVHKMPVEDGSYPVHRLAAKAQLKQLEHDLTAKMKETPLKEGNNTLSRFIAHSGKTLLVIN